jgi:succinyl-CoA synthetase alpha subunit
MGHAGAIISGGSGTAQAKVTALEKAGFIVAETPTEIPALLRRAGVS